MLKVICRVFCLAALTLAALGCVASVQDTVRIRGTIEKVDAAVYVVKSRDGFIAAAKKQPDGSLQTPRINYGKDGLTPPM